VFEELSLGGSHGWRLAEAVKLAVGDSEDLACDLKALNVPQCSDIGSV
jgi:hypothetical protein